jgi:phosphoserine phosphatase RsbU/P
VAKRKRRNPNFVALEERIPHRDALFCFQASPPKWKHAYFQRAPAQLGTMVRTMPAKTDSGKNRSPILHRLIREVLTRRSAHEAETQRAREIQTALLPREIPQLLGFRIGCAWQPSDAVSGDYFDVFPISNSAMALCVVDVSGKGLEAAELARQVREAVRQFAPESASPAELCTRVNRALSATIAPSKYVTLFYAVLDSSGRLQYENAGHCQPLLVRANGAVEFPASFSGVVGIFSHWLYQSQEVHLQPGDCLVLLTDGILEAENRRHEEFGYRRLIAEIERQQGPETPAQQILAAVTRHCGGRFADDASLVTVTMV